LEDPHAVECTNFRKAHKRKSRHGAGKLRESSSRAKSVGRGGDSMAKRKKELAAERDFHAFAEDHMSIEELQVARDGPALQQENVVAVPVRQDGEEVEEAEPASEPAPPRRRSVRSRNKRQGTAENRGADPDAKKSKKG